MKNADLWKRIDHAMQIHDVRCRHFRVDAAHPEHGKRPNLEVVKSAKSVKRRQEPSRPKAPLAIVARWTVKTLRHAADGVQRLIPEASPHPTM